MIENESDRFVSQLLEDLGPADPPAEFTASVMSRIVSQSHQHVGAKRTVSRHQEENVMTKKAMWSLAAAATIALAVLSYTGFPSVGRGTEGTIGAAKKAEQPQLTDKDVVLGDTAAQEFLQSAEFDQLAKDPDARSLLSDAAIRPLLRNKAFVDAIRNSSVRATLINHDVAELFSDNAARVFLENELRTKIKAQVAAADVKQSGRATVSAATRAKVAEILSSEATFSALKFDAVRSALSEAAVRDAFAKAGAAAALHSQVFAKAAAHSAFPAAAVSGRLSSAFGTR